MNTARDAYAARRFEAANERNHEHDPAFYVGYDAGYDDAEVRLRADRERLRLTVARLEDDLRELMTPAAATLLYGDGIDRGVPPIGGPIVTDGLGRRVARRLGMTHDSFIDDEGVG